MLKRPDSNEPAFRMISIDPGTDTLGYAIYSIDAITHDILGVEAYTLHGSKLAGNDSWLCISHSERFTRIRALRERLFEIFIRNKPIIFASEAPFFNRFHPQAYGSLVEVISAIESAMFDYSPIYALNLIDPPSVKKGVGAQRYAKKPEVQAAVLALSDLNYNGPIPISALDEHSIDAIAVGYTHYNRIFKNQG